MRTLPIATALCLATALLFGCDRQDQVAPTSSSVRLESSPPSEAPIFGTWHRLNPGLAGVNPTPEHELRRFHREKDGWAGRYDKHPEPKLGFENPPDRTFGIYRLTELTDPMDIVCLEGLPFNCPADVIFAVAGEGTFYNERQWVPGLEPFEPFSIPAQYLVTDQEVLWIFWLQFPTDPRIRLACPSFRSFEEALAANPFPLPFNGEDWPAPDCVVLVSE